MAKITINGTVIDVSDNTRIIDAADQVGIHIPRFCHHPGLPVAGNCRMCLVQSNKHPKLIPACHEHCQDGQIIETQSEEVLSARKDVLEFLLLNHPIDCPICDQAGECELQDLYFAHSHQASRQSFSKLHKDKARILGPHVIYDAERCINCTRCIRFSRDVAGFDQLCQIHRGESTQIDVFPQTQLDHPYSLCTVDLCPVGALTSRDFRFRCRVWFLQQTATICTHCSRGCNLWVDTYQDEIQRLVPRPNPEVNQYWACDEGRLAWKRYSENRLTHPTIKENRATHQETRAAFSQILHTEASKIALFLSPTLPNEDVEALLHLLGSYNASFTVTITGRPETTGDHFLRCADKNPNRAGIQRILASHHIIPTPPDALGDISCAIVAGEECPDPHRFRNILEQAKTLVVFACQNTDWIPSTTLLFPLPSPYEMSGTIDNVTGITQTMNACIPAPKEVVPLRDIVSAIQPGGES